MIVCLTVVISLLLYTLVTDGSVSGVSPLSLVLSGFYFVSEIILSDIVFHSYRTSQIKYEFSVSYHQLNIISKEDKIPEK